MFDKTTTTNENGHFQFQFFNNRESINLPVSSSSLKLKSNDRFTEVPKPIINGKSKVFINKPDDTSSEEDEHKEPSIPEQ
jgi:hypothetical protein